MSNLTILTGGQTGVDRAAMDAALALGIAIGGWCPQGRKAEDGVIAVKYPLKETRSPQYGQRTLFNARDAQVVLVLMATDEEEKLGFTLGAAKRFQKPLFILNLDHPESVEEVCQWLKDQQASVINIAGPRESNSPGIYERAYAYLTLLFKALLLTPVDSTQ